MGQKKKLSKKEKARLEAEQAELLRIEMEKEKQRKLEEERERKQREREEAEKRQKLEVIENRIRRNQLKESVSYFDSIFFEIEKIKDDAKRQKEWERYMRCNGLPSANNPSDLRKYIHMWSTTMIESKSRQRNWLLRTDERTILTQDKTVCDLTRETLRRKQVNLGDIYAQRIKEVLGVLIEMNDSIRDSKLPMAIVSDLKRLKNEIRQLLSEFIDDFTYRILSHVERDMEPDSPGISKQIYESDVFKTQLWTFEVESKTNNKDKFKDNSRHNEIDFPLLELQLMLPMSVKIVSSTIRCLWLNYDHFSDYSSSFEIPNAAGLKHLNILQQTKKEWKKRKEILQTTLDEASKDAPPTVLDALNQPQSRVVDADKIYTEYEDELNKARRKAMGPEAFEISEFHVNLRNHRIVGGVYCIDYLEQPQQDKRLNHTSFIRTITFPDKLKKKDFYEQYKPPPAPLPGVRRLPEEIEAEMKLIERNLDKLAMITLQLPDTVLWFEPPIVCRWERPEETALSENRTVASIDSTALKKVDTTRRKSSMPATMDLPCKIVQDFDMCNIPNTVDIFGLMVEFVVPRLPEGYCIRVEYQEKEHDDSVLRYLMKMPEGKRKSIPLQIVQPIADYLIETDRPRSLHPNVVFDKILQVTQSDPPAYTLQDENHAFARPEGYMFSQLVEDLDEICESQTPYQDQRVTEITSNLTSRRSSLQESPSRRFSGVIIIRESDVPKKDMINLKVNLEEDEDSGSEYDDEEEIIGDIEDTDESTKTAYYGKWSTRDVHDTKFNEDKLSIQFRTGRLGYFGFAANRYSNIPYQTWELKPDFRTAGTVSFSLTAAVISLEIQISNRGYCVNAFQGGTTETLTGMIGHVYSLNELKLVLTKAAVDIFPDEDAFCYAEGSCEKNFVMEMHLYNCMASLGLTHNFSWSRWNLLSGSRTAVLLMREMQEGKKVPNHSTLFVTPMKASIVDCTEVSACFSTVGVPGMEFYADLYHLAREHSQAFSKEKQATMNPIIRDNIAQIMQAVRPLSFC